MSSLQHAIVLEEVGKPLARVQRPVKAPGKDQVLVKVTAAALIPLDWKLRDLNAFNISESLPSVLGIEVAGTIVEHGPSESTSTDYPPLGTRVFFQTPPVKPLDGGLQEFVVTDPKWALPIPPGITDEQATTLLVNPFTAAVVLFHSNGFGLPFPGTADARSFDYRSVKLVVVGAGTSVGKFVVQLAHIAGISTIVAIASTASFTELTSYGATHLVDRTSSDVVEQVHAIVGPDLKYAFDAFNRGHPKQAVSFFQQKGGVLIQATVSTDVDQAELDERGVSLKRIQGLFQVVPDLFQLWKPALHSWVVDGSLKIPPFKVVPGLDATLVDEALDDIKRGGSGVKYVVRVQEP